jgi:hypothetical protein
MNVIKKIIHTTFCSWCAAIRGVALVLGAAGADPDGTNRFGVPPLQDAIMSVGRGKCDKLRQTT